MLEPNIPKEVESDINSLPLPNPLQESVDPNKWIKKFQEPFSILIKHKETKHWLEQHFEKLAFGYRGLTTYFLCDAVLSVPPLAKLFDAIVKQLEQSLKAAVFGQTGTGKSRLLTYLAYYWHKKYDRPIFFVDHPQGVKIDQWEEFVKFIIQISDRNKKYPLLIIIEDLHTVTDLTKEFISSLIQQASIKTYAVICTYTISDKLCEKEKEKQDCEYWEKKIYHGTDRLENFDTYWERWQPFFFAYLKWMAPNILERKVPKPWSKEWEKKRIFREYKSPWSFVVGLGYLETAFKNEFLSKKSDPLKKALYLFLHLIFLCNYEQPIQTMSYLRLIQNGLKNYNLDVKCDNLDNLVIESLRYWSSREKRLLPPLELEYQNFQQHILLPIYHQEWAKDVINLLYTQNTDFNFNITIDTVLKQIYIEEYFFWEQIQYKKKPLKFLQFLIDSIRFLDQNNLLSSQSLDLRNKNFTTISESIGRLSSLKTLNLAKNELISLPESLRNLKSLQKLSLENNKLTTFPESVMQLKSLVYLNLKKNKLSTIPESISNLKSLQSLDLSRNKFSTLQESLSNLNSLQTLNIAKNEFSTLPESLSNLKILQNLNLRSNNFTTLPDSITELTLLQTLNLSSNNFMTLPDSIKQLKSLKSINLRSNNFINLPDSITELKLLQTLNISSNKLSSLLESTSNLKSLQKLNLNRNKFLNLPESITKLKSLEKLWLGGNQLSTLPESLSNLSSLQALDLSSNKFSTLPECVTELKSLQILRLNNNQLSTLPESLLNLKSLQTLHLNNNIFTILPKSVKKLKRRGVHINILDMSLN